MKTDTKTAILLELARILLLADDLRHDGYPITADNLEDSVNVITEYIGQEKDEG